MGHMGVSVCWISTQIIYMGPKLTPMVSTHQKQKHPLLVDFSGEILKSSTFNLDAEALATTCKTGTWSTTDWASISRLLSIKRFTRAAPRHPPSWSVFKRWVLLAASVYEIKDTRWKNKPYMSPLSRVSHKHTHIKCIECVRNLGVRIDNISCWTG